MPSCCAASTSRSKRWRNALHEPRVVLGEAVRQPVLEPAEERGLGGPAKRVEPGVRDADQRRGEHGQQRAIVVAAAQEPQVGAQVGDLLAAVVAAADRPVRVEPRLLQRGLVQVGGGARAQQHDHLRLRGGPARAARRAGRRGRSPRARGRRRSAPSRRRRAARARCRPAATARCRVRPAAGSRRRRPVRRPR